MKNVITNKALIFLITIATGLPDSTPAFSQRQVIRLSHHVNTGASEYFPCMNANGTKIYFNGMDRTGFFDVRIDFTKAKNSGGEDIFTSSLENGLWTDVRSIPDLNTNAHEAVTQVLCQKWWLGHSGEVSPYACSAP